jgi:hypothetical protein
VKARGTPICLVCRPVLINVGHAVDGEISGDSLVVDVDVDLRPELLVHALPECQMPVIEERVMLLRRRSQVLHRPRERNVRAGLARVDTDWILSDAEASGFDGVGV